jgi:Cell wall-active antibiotics response LiaF, C-terminal
MRNWSPIVFGGGLILLGVLLVISNIFHVDFWPMCWPTVLILLGVWLLLRPQLEERGVNFVPIGNFRRYGARSANSEDFYLFIGDIRLDLAQAELPTGETTFRSFGFIGDVDVTIPANIGLKISSNAFVNDAKVMGRKFDQFLTPYVYTSENYASAECKVRIENYFFIIDLDVRQS